LTPVLKKIGSMELSVTSDCVYNPLSVKVQQDYLWHTHVDAAFVRSVC